MTFEMGQGASGFVEHVADLPRSTSKTHRLMRPGRVTSLELHRSLSDHHRTG